MGLQVGLKSSFGAMDDSPQMTIGEVAARSGVAASAIRFYESLGLLAEPEREHGQRRYGEDVVGRLGFIGVAQQAGLSLEEIRGLISEVDRGAGLGAPIRTLTGNKLPEVEALIARARAMQGWLQVASECECATPEECGLFPAPGESGWDADRAIEVVRVPTAGAGCRRA
jgi:MerR family transcriptional regulator, redox-sensitive transcriptional activator SoxR